MKKQTVKQMNNIIREWKIGYIKTANRLAPELKLPEDMATQSYANIMSATAKCLAALGTSSGARHLTSMAIIINIDTKIGGFDRDPDVCQNFRRTKKKRRLPVRRKPLGRHQSSAEQADNNDDYEKRKLCRNASHRQGSRIFGNVFRKRRQMCHRDRGCNVYSRPLRRHHESRAGASARTVETREDALRRKIGAIISPAVFF
ncbi:MAG: hypothetical protein LBT45_00010 [Rickettsiales bacterium]|jgi:hypothetical protein|nr:hypothetical protein [Rickettsiales bacterium]